MQDVHVIDDFLGAADVAAAVAQLPLHTHALSSNYSEIDSTRGMGKPRKVDSPKKKWKSLRMGARNEAQTSEILTKWKTTRGAFGAPQGSGASRRPLGGSCCLRLCTDLLCFCIISGARSGSNFDRINCDTWGVTCSGGVSHSYIPGPPCQYHGCKARCTGSGTRIVHESTGDKCPKCSWSLREFHGNKSYCSRHC